MKKNRNEIVEYINTLKGYEGYVQFSHRPIEIEKDVFEGRDPKIEDLIRNSAPDPSSATVSAFS